MILLALMTEQEAKKWAKNKANQDKVIKDIFKTYKPNKSNIAFYLAGIPGSGKTEFAHNTINDALPNLVPIEHDKLVEYIDGYRPEDYYVFRKAGSILVTRLLGECLKNGYGFIFDGTLSHPQGLNNIRKTLSEGYKLIVVYIIQDALTAWELTQDRELLKKRKIEKEGFIETCQIINRNLLSIFDAFKNNDQFSFWMINKKGSSLMGSASSIIYSNKQIGRAIEIESALKFSYNTGMLGKE